MESTHQEMIDYNRYIELKNKLTPIAEELQRLSQILTTDKGVLRGLAARRLPLENEIEDLASRYGSRDAIESLREKVERRKARLAREAETLRIESEIKEAPIRTRDLATKARTTYNTLVELVTKAQRDSDTIRGEIPVVIRDILRRINACKERAESFVKNAESQIALSDSSSTGLDAVRNATESLTNVNRELHNIEAEMMDLTRIINSHLERIAAPHIKQLLVLRDNWLRANETYLAAFPSSSSWYFSYVRYTVEQRAADEGLKAAEKEYTAYFNTNADSLRPRDIEIYKIQTIKDEIAKITSARDLAAASRERETRRKAMEEEIAKVNTDNQPRIDTLNGEIKALESQIVPLEERITELNSAITVLGVAPSMEKTKLNGEKRTRETELKRIRESIETKRGLITTIETEMKTQIASIRTRAGLAGGSKYGDDDENDEEYWKQKYLKYKAKYIKLKNEL